MDVLFGINLIMDLIIMIIVNRICGYAATYLKIFCSATFGAIWSVIAVIMPVNIRWFVNICTYILVSYGMIRICAGRGEIKDVIKWAKVLTEDGEVVTLNAEELELGYRTSIVQKKNMIVLQMCIKLDLGSQEEIALIMQMFMQKRKAKQPLEYPSAGSTFKRPEGYFAGKLIEDAGLRGYQVGGAMVSEKHCGFVINYDNATATDILQLMDDVKATVKEQYF